MSIRKLKDVADIRIQGLESGFCYGIRNKTQRRHTSFATFRKDIRCKCGDSVEDVYVYIIELLQKANLLPTDFKLVCCSCYNREKSKNMTVFEIDGMIYCE